MEYSEISSNIAFYKGLIQKEFSLSIEPVRFRPTELKPLDQRWATAKHAMHMIGEIEEMISTSEKEQRIHRHYGFLQALILLLIPNYSLERLLQDNKFGAK